MAKPVVYKFDPFKLAGISKTEVKKENRNKVLEQVAKEIVKQTKVYVSKGRSPVRGHDKFPKLSSDYAKEMKNGNTNPNLKLKGDYLDNLDAPIKDDKLIFSHGESQNDKADGHNNFSGNSNLPMRRTIPNSKEGETFKKPIVDAIRRIIKENK